MTVDIVKTTVDNVKATARVTTLKQFIENVRFIENMHLVLSTD